MKLLNTLIILLLLFSCTKKEEVVIEKGQYIGGWDISQDIFFEPSETTGFEQPPGNVDTACLIMGENGVLKPTNQAHEVFINSSYLLLAPNSVFEFSVDDLLEGQFTFIYKSEEVDLSTVKKITISIHGEQLSSDKVVNDKDVSVLLRLCSSSNLNDNYFEIEKPIVLTKHGTSVLSELWPDDNFINLEIDKLKSFKAERDSLATLNSMYEYGIYIETENEERYSIYKNPDITNLNRICIGLKNPGEHTSFNNNDGLPKSIKIWIY